MVVVPVVAPIVIPVPAPAKLTVVAVALTKLNVVALVVISPPSTFTSPSTSNALLTFVVPVAAPICDDGVALLCGHIHWWQYGAAALKNGLFGGFAVSEGSPHGEYQHDAEYAEQDFLLRSEVASKFE